MAQNGVFERLARSGYVTSALLHLIIGYLAIRIALGSGRRDADPSGALAAVASQRGGNIALWFAAAAFLLMSLWRLVETALGRSTDPKTQGALAEITDRAKAFALAVVYFAFAYSTFGFARGAGESSAHQNSTMRARLMQTGVGTVALFAAGVIIVAAGVLVIVAVSRSQPEKATGLDGALKALGAQPYGVVLLVSAAVGIIIYGLFSFVMARYTKSDCFAPSLRSGDDQLAT